MLWLTWRAHDQQVVESNPASINFFREHAITKILSVRALGKIVGNATMLLRLA